MARKSREKTVHIGSDGKEMTSSQVWLYRLCMVVLIWVGAEAVLGVLSLVGVSIIPVTDAPDDMQMDVFVAILGVTTLVGAAMNLFGALLGIRGARNPRKIGLFFWMTLANGVLCAWDLASGISTHTLNPSSAVSSLFVIVMAVCAWQVRSQTGYFDNHPTPETEPPADPEEVERFEAREAKIARRKSSAADSADDAE